MPEPLPGAAPADSSDDVVPPTEGGGRTLAARCALNGWGTPAWKKSPDGAGPASIAPAGACAGVLPPVPAVVSDAAPDAAIAPPEPAPPALAASMAPAALAVAPSI